MSETIDRPKFRELRYKKDREIPEQYDIVQLKMDGIWGCLKVSNGQWAIYSRTGKMKADGVIKDKSIDVILLGEFMFGSHWGKKKGLDREFFIFDCLRFQGEDIANKPLTERTHCSDWAWQSLKSELGWLDILETYEVYDWHWMWDEYIQEYGYEGLVFKDSSSVYSDKRAWARMKAVVEIDYICTGFRPADEGTKYEGLAGSVIGTLIDKDVFITCGGLDEEMRRIFTNNPEMFIGQVFTAKGNNWYPSGAIRHPIFQRWRADKEPTECSYEQIPEGIRCLA
tara:strand:- start:44 stop:892 length:849 start_codon:yes stop_codon:yes gene_type:complete